VWFCDHGIAGEAEVKHLPTVIQLIQGGIWPPHQGFQLLVLHFVHCSGPNWGLDVLHLGEQMCPPTTIPCRGWQGQSSSSLCKPKSCLLVLQRLRTGLVLIAMVFSWGFGQVSSCFWASIFHICEM
jgi:hypothetical protein